ncbi:MAG: TIGR02530 family flagellar biosynthesis protein [Bacillota bacterium]
MSLNVYFPGQPPVSSRTVPGAGNSIKKKGADFREILGQTIAGSQKLMFSQHARQRLELRRINLTELDLKKIETAVDVAQEKGIKDSLILLKDVALVVNVPNRTIITAVEGSNLKNKVFTHIDGAVII